MIRLILRDLFPGRSTVGALRARVAELEHENKAIGEAYARVNVYNRNLNEECDRLISERDDARGDVEKLSAEVDALQKRALRPTPTPGEARMLEIVRANPGLLTAQLCDLARPGTIAVELEKYRREYGEPPANSWLLTGAQTRSEDEAQYLTGLHKKSLVRRERSGNTYRYWVSE